MGWGDCWKPATLELAQPALAGGAQVGFSSRAPSISKGDLGGGLAEHALWTNQLQGAWGAALPVEGALTQHLCLLLGRASLLLLSSRLYGAASCPRPASHLRGSAWALESQIPSCWFGIRIPPNLFQTRNCLCLHC